MNLIAELKDELLFRFVLFCLIIFYMLFYFLHLRFVSEDFWNWVTMKLSISYKLYAA